MSRTIDADTGELANEWCPHTREEWFKPGTEPVACERPAPSIEKESA